MSNPYVNEITELPQDPLGGASGEKRLFNVQFLGKTNNDLFPYTVANEVVASQIGKALGLNLPTVLTDTIEGVDFALVQMVGEPAEMQRNPPASAVELAEYVRNEQHEIHGAIIFDLYMANNDRAFSPIRRNLKLDPEGRLLLYDNGNACFYRNRPSQGVVAGVTRLDAVEANLASMFDMDHKENHYREFLTNWELVREWCRLIRDLPDFLIESAVRQIPKNSAGLNEKSRLVEFLKKRRGCLLTDIERNIEKFPGLNNPGE